MSWSRPDRFGHGQHPRGSVDASADAGSTRQTCMSVTRSRGCCHKRDHAGIGVGWVDSISYSSPGDGVGGGDEVANALGDRERALSLDDLFDPLAHSGSRRGRWLASGGASRSASMRFDA